MNAHESDAHESDAHESDASVERHAHSSHPPSAHEHSHAHMHDHDHGHAHGPPPGDFSAAFAIGIGLNLAFVILEGVYGILAHSMALVADAGHNLSDVLGLGLSWGALWLAKRRPTKRHTYGLRGTTIFASLLNALALLLVTGGITWESVRRLASPQPVAGMTVVVVALAGVLVNASAAALFMKGRKGDLNVRSAFMHLASDAVLALGVAVAGGIMMWTGWLWLDPIVSIVLSVIILASTWSLLKSSMHLALGAVPEGIDPEAVFAYLSGLRGVIEVHDLHIWAMSTTETALTVHLVMEPDACHSRFLAQVGKALHDKFQIGHPTLQVEPPEAPDPCRLAPEEAL